jgi:hypothetical protein
MFQNPKAIMEQNLQQQMNLMIQQNPMLYQKVQEMTAGKNESELKEVASNIAKERGINLSQFASQFGLKI